MSGWIKLHRSIVDWEWFTDHRTFYVFTYLLMKANHTSKLWQGKQINRGELITSLSKLAAETSVSTQEVRTILNRLEKSGAIYKKSTNKFTLIKVLKYELYQGKEYDEQQTEQQSNNNQTTNEQQQLKNVKNSKNEKNSNNDGGDVKNFLENLFANDPSIKSIEEMNAEREYGNEYYNTAYSFTQKYISQKYVSPEHAVFLSEFFANQEKACKMWTSSVDVVKHYLNASKIKFESLIKSGA